MPSLLVMDAVKKTSKASDGNALFVMILIFVAVAISKESMI